MDRPPAGRLDPSALTEPADRQALDRFVAESKRTGKPWIRVTTGKPRRGIGHLVTLFLPVLVPVAGLTVLGAMAGFDALAELWQLLGQAPQPIALVVLGVVGGFLLVQTTRAVLVIRSMLVPRAWWEAAYRLTRLAAANGLRYGHDETDSYPGAIFGVGYGQTFERRLTTTTGRRVEIGNYRYLTRHDSDDEPEVHGWGYVSITLDRRLPHLLLDAKANDKGALGLRLSNLPLSLDPDQRLSLGGEFDETFTLYAPSNYGRDAFYIFAPDLMALFVDRLGTFDVEIIDDGLYLYGDRFDLLDPRTYEWLAELVDTVVARTLRGTERYTDDFAAGADLAAEQVFGEPIGVRDTEATRRPASNVIAEGGRRLRRRGVGVGTVVALVLVVLLYLYDEIIAPAFGLPRW